MIEFWVILLAISILLYVLLDGFDLGVGMLFGLSRRLRQFPIARCRSQARA